MPIPPGYSTACALTVTTTTAVSGATTVPVALTGTDYVVRVHLTGAAALNVYNRCHDQINGMDLTLWWSNGGSLHQLDVDVETISSSTISLWFKLQASIGASSTDTNYLLACGNASPTVKQNLNNIYPLWDDFNGGSLDTSKWTNYNGVNISFSGSIMTLVNSTTTDIHGNNCAVQSIHQFGAGYAIRAKGTMPKPTVTASFVHSSLRFNNGDSSQLPPPGNTRCEATLISDPGNTTSSSPNYPNDWVVWSFRDGLTVPFQQGDLQVADSTTRVFNLGREPSAGNAYGWIDEGSVVSTTYASCTTAGYVWMAPTGYDMSNVVTQTWDWIKIRPFVAAEPVVTAALPTFFPPPPIGWPFA